MLSSPTPEIVDPALDLKEDPDRVDNPTTSKLRKTSVAAVAGGLATATASALANPFSQVSLQNIAPQCPVILSGPPKEVLLAFSATFGYTEYLEQTIVNTGYDAWLTQQLGYKNWQEWIDFERSLLYRRDYNFSTIFLDPCSPEANDLICNSNGTGLNQEQIKRQLGSARVIRALHSPAQVFERVVEFWTDHLNTNQNAGQLRRMKTFEDKNTIRAHALGKLSDLLYNSATSPAMLLYLDGRLNIAGNPNENYARELLELHALGVDNCYTEQTIQVMARALTGWRLRVGQVDCCGEVFFNNNLHDNSAKVLNFPGCGSYSIPANSGINELGLVIDILTDPAKLGLRTARFIASKMATYFISCDPPKELIDEMVTAYTQAYQSGKDDISAMVQLMLSQRWIRCSEQKFKRPLMLMTSAIRALQVIVRQTGHVGAPGFTLIGNFLGPAGHIPYHWPAPDGYPAPCDTDYWASNLLNRWNFGASLAHDEYTGVYINSALLEMQPLVNSQQVVNYLNDKLFAGFWPFNEQSIVLNFLGRVVVDDAAKRNAISLAIGSPTFQQY